MKRINEFLETNEFLVKALDDSPYKIYKLGSFPQQERARLSST